MMNEALQLIYYTLSRFLDFMFNAYIFEGISIGMILVVSYVFVVMLRYLLAVPRINVGSRDVKNASYSERSHKGGSDSN